MLVTLNPVLLPGDGRSHEKTTQATGSVAVADRAGSRGTTGSRGGPWVGQDGAVNGRNSVNDETDWS